MHQNKQAHWVDQTVLHPTRLHKRELRILDFDFSVNKAKEPQLEYHKTYLINQTGMQGNKPTGTSSEV